MVRNAYNFDCNNATNFWFVIKDRFEGDGEYNSKMRNQLRRSQRQFEFRLIDRDYLVAHGYEVFCQAAKSYKVKLSVPTLKEFEESTRNAVENEFWGAFDRQSHRLVAYAKNTKFDHSCDYSTLKATPEALRQYVYYGLLHEMNRYYLQELSLDFVNDGARSITEHSNMQPFLIEKFHFRRAYCDLQLVYRPLIAATVKLLYPFRRIVPIRSVRAILNQEAMSR